MQVSFDPPAQLLSLLGGRLLRFGGRHLAIVEHLDHLQPRLRSAPHVGKSCELFQVQVPFLLRRRMTAHAELFQQRSCLCVIGICQFGERNGRRFRRAPVGLVRNCKAGESQAEQGHQHRDSLHGLSAARHLMSLLILWACHDGISEKATMEPCYSDQNE